MLLYLSESLEEIRNTPEIRVVILTGGPDAFSGRSGISESAQSDPDQMRLGHTICDLIKSYRVPVIVAVDGVAAGRGCEIVLAAHLSIASRNSRFTLSEIRTGEISHEEAPLLDSERGSEPALEMMLRHGVISAEQALKVGLINRVVDQEDLMVEAESLANEISNLAPLAIRACLEAVNKGMDLPFEDGLALENRLFASLFATADAREGTRAFLEKRAPVFKGT